MALDALAEWVVSISGDNPARTALHAAQNVASERFARQAATLDQHEKELAEEREALSLEQQRLEQGEDAAPPSPYFRDATARLGRSGAPLWQLLEFREAVAEPQRVGLEAALEASGLLDAWVAPDAEAWIAPDGRFRVGPLAGAWVKPAATYIGYAARAAARARRLAEIARRLTEMGHALDWLREDKEKLDRERRQAALEWSEVPSDEDLRAAHVEAAACARAYTTAEAALRQASARLAEAERRWIEARDRLAVDAQDLRLPSERGALDAVESALHGFNDDLQQFFLAAQAVRHALPELQAQRGREAEATAEEARSREQSAEKQFRAEEAQARWQALFDSVGLKVEEVLQRLAAAREAVKQGEEDLKAVEAKLRDATEARARAEQKAEDCAVTLEA